ncbi:6-phosphogluconolactonase [Algimonas porphyrae]|uniref:6-phosphogluconolactonase n=1 Tax=Algimonas porphyrae TaxID=1128113 RepID=A0ABQ5UVG7_9PROT|nr:6-phosphogluconolactonase [Algimonas porphyrae]GLQ19248.1 6-phosphogluconolactonase [Algimonas porphyrae]
MSAVDITLFQDEAALIGATVADLTTRLQSALSQRGRASLMLSGGSSPKPVYEALAQQPIAWDGVGISLVDERWVPPGVPGSNADFVQACFAGTPAERAHFVPLYNGHDDAASGVESAEQALSTVARPFDICVMGMGLDGHTASWFPHSRGLEAALRRDNLATLCSIDATGCAVAGDHTDRMTLTYAAVAASRHVCLLLNTAEKLDVFRQSLEGDVTDRPVASLAQLGSRLSVHAVENAS